MSLNSNWRIVLVPCQIEIFSYQCTLSQNIQHALVSENCRQQFNMSLRLIYKASPP